MEIFIIKLTIAVIPLFVLVASVITISHLSSLHKSLSWHRTRHSVLRTLGNGAMLR